MAKINLIVRMTKEQIKQLDELSKKNFQKRSEFIRAKLFEAIENEE